MNCGLYLHFFGLLNILSLAGGSFSGRGCTTCHVSGILSSCISQERMCDGYKDCRSGADEKQCGRNSKYCKVIPAHDSLRITCQYPRFIQIDDAWFDHYRYCSRNNERQSEHSDSFRYCNNQHRCRIKVTGQISAKIMYHCKDTNIERTRQTSVLSRKTWSSPMVPKLTNKTDRLPKAPIIVSSPSHIHGKITNENVLKFPATSGFPIEHATSIKTNVNTTPKYNFKINNTNFLEHILSTNHNHIHKTTGVCNYWAFNNRFGVSKTVTEDTIPTINNNRRPTYVTHINKTFIKHESKTDKRKQKSQVAPIAGSVSAVMFVICIVLLMVAVRRHMVRRNISKGKDRTTKSTSKNKCREGSNSFEGQNNIPLYSSVNKLTKSELGKTMPQSISISNIGYDEVCDFNVQNEDYDHIERVGRRADVDMVYSLTTYQKTEDDYDISGNFNESLRNYQENSIYD